MFPESSGGTIQDGSHSLDIAAFLTDYLADVLLGCFQFNYQSVSSTDLIYLQLIRVIHQRLRHDFNQIFHRPNLRADCARKERQIVLSVLHSTTDS